MTHWYSERNQFQQNVERKKKQEKKERVDSQSTLSPEGEEK